ncbi:MAG: hypothetical protein LH609_13825 [Rudanella sp.]|nr:hypothetical protein [Rudanella sp.]
MSACGYTSETLQVGVNVEKQEIDVDQAIPLELILNEILTNAFEYALLTRQISGFRSIATVSHRKGIVWLALPAQYDPQN